ncbi:hypothetical protein [Azospirillum sp. TSO35-2]|uniref:hypothetical protein n=1 Tax=Azospirillum sp. TSO35-2 TaxID=716796 RepID=UPI000D61CEEA|nr:hypothetical protein [Azospirillum sp. TSO35-2]PWC39593.1 hypothetical protein TSO352_05560 [Azospirillum sp. TSO35-2]
MSKAHAIPWTSKIQVIKDALDQFEGNRIRRWQVINRLVSIGLSADDANMIADHGSIPPHILNDWRAARK